MGWKKYKEAYLHTGGGCMVLELTWQDEDDNRIYTSMDDNSVGFLRKAILDCDEEDYLWSYYKDEELNTTPYHDQSMMFMIEDTIRSYVSIIAAHDQIAIYGDDVYDIWRSL